MEENFDVCAAGDGLAVRAGSWAHLPLLDAFDGFFVQAEAGAGQNDGVDDAAVSGDGDVEHDGALIFGFACLIRVFRRWAIDALWLADTVHAGAEVSAAGATAIAGAQAATGAAADAAVFAGTEAATAAGAARKSLSGRKWITQVVHIRIRNL